MSEFFSSFFFALWSPRIASNVPAASRRRGFHCRPCGVITFNFAQNCLQVTAAITPNRLLCVRACFKSHFVNLLFKVCCIFFICFPFLFTTNQVCLLEIIICHFWIAFVFICTSHIIVCICIIWF